MAGFRGDGFRATLLDGMLARQGLGDVRDLARLKMRAAEQRPAPAERARPQRKPPAAIVAPVVDGRVAWERAQPACGAVTVARPVPRAAPARRSRAPRTGGRSAEGRRGGSGQRPTPIGKDVEIIYGRLRRG